MVGFLGFVTNKREDIMAWDRVDKYSKNIPHPVVMTTVVSKEVRKRMRILAIEQDRPVGELWQQAGIDFLQKSNSAT